MTSPPNFGWTDFYMEFADKLLAYKNNRAELFDKTTKVVRNVMGQEECYLDRSHGGNLTEICPFSVMGTFNRRISDTNRKKIAAEIGASLEVDEPVPDFFDSIPVLDNRQSVVFHNISDIDPLWRVFEDAIRLAGSESEDARQSFSESYDSVFKGRGIGRKLSIGLFWIRPRSFLPLDNKSETYIRNTLGLSMPAKMPPLASEYLELVNSLKKHFEFPVHSFQELSLAAYG